MQRGNMKDIEICILMNLAGDTCEFLELRAGSYIIPHPEFYFPHHDDPEICREGKNRQYGIYHTLLF